jgi:hypothetical protein
LLSGMPPFYPPIALVMSIEGTLMAAAAAVIYRFSKPRIWPALIAAVALDRMVSTGLMWLMAGNFGLPPAVISAASFIQGVPGVALQLVVVPLAVRGLRARKGILLSNDD